MRAPYPAASFRAYSRAASALPSRSVATTMVFKPDAKAHDFLFAQGLRAVRKLRHRADGLIVNRVCSRKLHGAVTTFTPHCDCGHKSLKNQHLHTSSIRESAIALTDRAIHARGQYGSLSAVMKNPLKVPDQTFASCASRTAACFASCFAFFRSFRNCPGSGPRLARHRSQSQGSAGKLTLEEKIQLIGGVDSMFTNPIPSIDLPRFKMSDASVGVRTWGPTTAYAGGVALAATWDRQFAK